MENIEENGSTSSFNPAVTDDLKEEDLEKIKGDSIGTTLYSERFVLSTLLKLTKIEKDLSEDEDFEKDLCHLWDMTIEVDVIKLLLEHKVLELFSTIIKMTEDRRLTEILVGIIGNMCSISDTRDELCINQLITEPIIDLVGCSDSLILVQLMRFFNAALVFENSGDEILWFQHFKNCEDFVEKFAFILKNSMQTSLLISSLEALSAICSKFAVIELQADPPDDICFRDLFIKRNLIGGVMEAFNTLLPDSNKETNDDTSTPTQHSQRIMNLFLDLNVIFAQYDLVSKNSYQPYLSDLTKCFSQILSPLCQPISLLPLTSNEQGVVENINEISQALDDPFDETGTCFAQMITIWKLIERDHDEKEQKAASSTSPKWGNDCDQEDINPEEVNMTILEYLTRTVRNASDENLKNSISLHNPRTIIKLLDKLSAGNSEPEIKNCFTRIKNVFDELSNDYESSPNGSR